MFAWEKATKGLIKTELLLPFSEEFKLYWGCMEHCFDFAGYLRSDLTLSVVILQLLARNQEDPRFYVLKFQVIE